MMTASERLDRVTGKVFADETLTALPRKRLSGSTAKETIGVELTISPTFIMVYITNWLKQGWQKCYKMRCGDTYTIMLFRQKQKHIGARQGTHFCILTNFCSLTR
jgi:hypothetical protein